MADLPPEIIPVKPEEFDLLYPRYELQKPGISFQQWLRQQRAQQHEKP